MKLLNREEKLPDELFTDYMSRLAYRNGFNSFYEFTRKVRQRGQLLDYLRFQVGIEDLVGRKIDASLDQSFLSNRYNFTYVGICEECFFKQPYIRWYWRLSIFSICAIHRTQLKRYETSFDCFLNINAVDGNNIPLDVQEQVDIQLFHLDVHSIQTSIGTLSKYNLYKLFIGRISEFYREHFLELNTEDILMKLRYIKLLDTPIEDTLPIILGHLADGTRYDQEHIKIISLFVFFQMQDDYPYRFYLDVKGWVFQIFDCPKFPDLTTSSAGKELRFTEVFQGYHDISVKGDWQLTNLLSKIASSYYFSRKMPKFFWDIRSL